jgi:hypothetical protein
MMTPEVSRFAARVINVGRRAVDLSGTTEAVRDRLEIWRRVTREIQEVGQRTRTVADLPQWLLDLAERLGVERHGEG